MWSQTMNFRVAMQEFAWWAVTQRTSELSKLRGWVLARDDTVYSTTSHRLRINVSHVRCHSGANLSSRWVYRLYPVRWLHRALLSPALHTHLHCLFSPAAYDMCPQAWGSHTHWMVARIFLVPRKTSALHGDTVVVEWQEVSPIDVHKCVHEIAVSISQPL